MRLQRPLTVFGSLVAALALIGLAACTPVAAAKPDPISQTHAGYVMYPNPGVTFQQISMTVILPSFICLPKQTNTVRWFIAMDGIAGASNLGASARAGLILGCRNGVPSYTPYYGIYPTGQSTPDKAFARVSLAAGQYLTFAVGIGYGNVEFFLSRGAPGQRGVPLYQADLFVPSTLITGTAVGCLLEATTGASALPDATAFEVPTCTTYTNLAGNGRYWAPNRGETPTRSYNVSTKAGKALTRLDALGPEGAYDITER